MAHGARRFRLEDMKHAFGGQIAKASVVQDDAVKFRRTHSIQTNPIHRLRTADGIPNPMGFN